MVLCCLSDKLRHVLLTWHLLVTNYCYAVRKVSHVNVSFRTSFLDHLSQLFQ